MRLLPPPMGDAPLAAEGLGMDRKPRRRPAFCGGWLPEPPAERLVAGAPVAELGVPPALPPEEPVGREPIFGADRAWNHLGGRFGSSSGARRPVAMVSLMYATAAAIAARSSDEAEVASARIESTLAA